MATGSSSRRLRLRPALRERKAMSAGNHYENAAKASTGGFQISSWSIRNPIPTIVFFLMMTIVGAMGFGSIRVNNWPDVDFPMVVVTVIRSGAAPTELENQVTRIVEDS